MIKYKCPVADGYIRLPHFNDFTGEMYNAYHDAIEAESDKELKGHAAHRVDAFAAARIIDKHGEWAIEGIPAGEFMSWQERPSAEKVRLVRWVRNVWLHYYVACFDPKELGPLPEDGS